MFYSASGFLAALAIALLSTACSGENYDPSASETATGKTQGKPIQGKVIAGKVDSNPEQENNGSTDLVKTLVGTALPSIDPAPSEDNNASVASQSSKLPPLPDNSPYREVAFRSISSFPYEVEWDTDGKEHDPTAFLKRVPREVRNLSGVKVAVEGFMIPTMVNEDNKVTEFLLLPDQMSCCYGKSPAANGWVVVTSDGIDIMMDQIIRVTGSMVVEERWDEEFFVGLYHLSCDDVTGPAL
jgi:hypothetical protein